MNTIQPIKWDLHENVVSTDYIDVAPKGYQFKGGVKYVLHYFTYATEWTDRENIKRFKKIDTLKAFYDKLDRGDIYDDYAADCIGEA